MAQLTIPKGLVARIFFGGKGVEVHEPYKTQTGETKSRKFTCWFNEPVAFAEGVYGSFTGTFSAKIDKWTDAEGNPKLDHTGQPGQSVVTSINDTQFTPDNNPTPTADLFAPHVKEVKNAVDLAIDAPF
jgi:hypothetical protein